MRVTGIQKVIPVLCMLMITAALTGCGGGGGTPAPSSATLSMNVDLSRVAGASSLAGSDVTVEIAAVAYDALANPVMDTSTTVTLAYDSADGKHKGNALLSGITPGSNVLARITVYSGTARTANQTGSAFAYLGAIMESLVDGEVTPVTVNEQTTVVAQAAIFYAVANGYTPSNTSVLTSSFLSTLTTTVATQVSNSTITPDNFILASSTGSDPFDSSNWTYQYAWELEAICDSMGLGDIIPPRVIDYSPLNAATNVDYMQPSLTIIFSESMDSSINLNNQTTLAASGYFFEMERRDNGHRTTLDSDSTLNYGTFAWQTTNFANDTLVFTLYNRHDLAVNGLAWLGAGLTYDVIDRNLSSYLSDTAGHNLDTRESFPTTNFPSTGYFTTAP